MNHQRRQGMCRCPIGGRGSCLEPGLFFWVAWTAKRKGGKHHARFIKRGGGLWDSPLGGGVLGVDAHPFLFG